MCNVRCPSFLYTEVVVVFISVSTSFYSGLGRSYIAILIPQLREKDSLISLSLEEESWLATVNLLPKIIGSLFGGIIMEIFGRKFVLCAVPLMFLLGWLVLFTFSTTIGLYTSMFLNGLASGMVLTSGVYAMEISSPKRRGFLMSISMPLLTCGMLVGNSVALVWKWRMSALYFSFYGVVNFLVMLVILPESPSWLVRRNRIEEASRVLASIRKDEMSANEELEELKSNFRESREKWSLFSIPRAIIHCWSQVRLMISIPILLQAAGYTTFNYYCVIFFEKLEFPVDASLTVMIYTVTVFVSSILSPVIIDKLSRRGIMIYTGYAMILSMAVTLVYEIVFLNSNTKPYFWIGAGGVYLYIAFLQCGIGSVGLMIAGEMSPLEYRGALGGFVISMMFVSGTLFAKFFPTLFLNSLGVINTLIFLLLVSLCIPLYTIFLLPETSGKTLQDIQKQYFTFEERNNEDADKKTDNSVA